MGLFDKIRKKKWEDEDTKVRMEGVEELLNSNKKGMEKQEILKGIAKNDPDSAVRLLAVQNLNGEELNEEIALNDSDWKVRKAAVENLIAYVKSNKRYFGDTHYSVNESLGNNGAQRLHERNTIATVEYRAARHLSHTRNDKIRAIGDENSIDTVGSAGPVTQWLQCQQPSPSSHHMAQYSKSCGEREPPKIHLIAHYCRHLRKVEVPVYPPQDNSAQCYREQRF